MTELQHSNVVNCYRTLQNNLVTANKKSLELISNMQHVEKSRVKS